jgi:hypothetical protein
MLLYKRVLIFKKYQEQVIYKRRNNIYYVNLRFFRIYIFTHTYTGFKISFTLLQLDNTLIKCIYINMCCNGKGGDPEPYGTQQFLYIFVFLCNGLIVAHIRTRN